MPLTLIAGFSMLLFTGFQQSNGAIPSELMEVKGVEAQTSGLNDGQPQDWERHDPSNIIKFEGKYLIWVTEHARNNGFSDCRIILLSSSDGLNWTFEQIALEKNLSTAWDDGGVLTPYVVPYQDKYYLFYLGVNRDFKKENTDRRGMGYVVADSPHGPWRRPPENQVLLPGDKDAWDGLSVDDPNIIRRGEKWYFYFKGRAMGRKTSETQIGFAVSDHLTGPYEKYEANPLFHGHAFTVTKFGNNLIALPGEVNKHLLWSSDGIHFTKGAVVKHKSTGVYNPADFEADGEGAPVEWFIDVVPGFPRVLRRVDLIYPGAGRSIRCAVPNTSSSSRKGMTSLPAAVTACCDPRLHGLKNMRAFWRKSAVAI